MTVNIQHIRLVNGEELLATVRKSTSDQVVIENPLIVQENDGYIVLVPFMPYSRKKSVSLSKNHVIALTDLHPEMEKHYQLSLKVARKHNNNTIDHIRQVNHQMEIALFKADEQSFDESFVPTAPTSNNVH